jgi:hypothetical protein
MRSLGKRGWGWCVVATVAIVLATAGPVRAVDRFALGAWDGAAVERARSGAVRRLQDANCQRVFSDFRDARGRTIQENLEDSGMTAAEYLLALRFMDGSRHPLCGRTRTALVSMPGVQRVMVCGTFADFQLRKPHLAESMVIHEVLHTLGLRENPPSSAEITARVESRCR